MEPKRLSQSKVSAVVRCRFLGRRNGSLTAVGHPVASGNESPRANESFQAVTVCGYNDFYQRCPIEEDDNFSLVQVYGFD